MLSLMGHPPLAANVCIPFEELRSTSDVVEFVKRHEALPGIAKWALYVQRGPKAATVLRNGVHSSLSRFVHTRPVSPYRGLLFLRRRVEIEDEREIVLRDEVNKLGTYNIAVRFPRSGDLERAVNLVVKME